MASKSVRLLFECRARTSAYGQKRTWGRGVCFAPKRTLKGLAGFPIADAQGLATICDFGRSPRVLARAQSRSPSSTRVVNLLACEGPADSPVQIYRRQLAVTGTGSQCGALPRLRRLLVAGGAAFPVRNARRGRREPARNWACLATGDQLEGHRQSASAP